MAYNPYANTADFAGQSTNRHSYHQQLPQQQQQSNQGGFQQPNSQYQYQQQQPPQQQPQYQQGTAHIPQQFLNQPAGGNYSNFFNDPTSNMTFQVGQNAMMAGSQMLEQNLSKYVQTGDIKYYFKVSNTYVLNKMLLILFPFRHSNWVRGYRRTENVPQQQQQQQQVPPQQQIPRDAGVELYAFPLEDTNAPDLYLPLMSIVTYILTIALISGLRGDFHPEVFGMKTSTTLLLLFLEFVFLRGGLYVLNINVKFWDLICYIGYKFIPVVLILVIKNLSGFSLLNGVAYVYLLLSYGYFELRSIRFNLFAGLKNTAQNVSNTTVKNSNYFLFIYTFGIQAVLFWFLG
ncbi:hypothetical protein WICPIJ_001749 [Wickerhamomyces pijperi]|uniref:Protein YIF1 n=1 Tax=Wickerhamomyces pijperi TaxID=599730 RepID=A0A9P8QB40_WICPI|nr:hypothetical protein WICPIJ_001749 [Wickerhamomyces pijperi]